MKYIIAVSLGIALLVLVGARGTNDRQYEVGGNKDLMWRLNTVSGEVYVCSSQALLGTIVLEKHEHLRNITCSKAPLP